MNRHKKLGAAFPDQLFKATHPFGHFKNRNFVDLDVEESLLPNFDPSFLGIISVWRIVALVCLFLLIFFGLFLRLFHLQIVLGKQQRELADSNRVQIRTIHAPRGVIYDRNNKILAENNPGFRLDGHFISRDEALKLEAENNPKLADLEVDTIRSYPYGAVIAHAVGYVGEVSEEELKKPEYQNYKIGDRLGRAGVEEIYESVLKGKDGAEIVEIDAQGKKLRTLRKVDPKPGRNVYLSIDVDLQQEVFDELSKGLKSAKSCCGVAVAENPKNGEILSLVSLPSYDGNVFTDPKRNNEAAEYFTDAHSPLLNRVIAGEYPPGSTFKITSALAGLSSGKVSPKTNIQDTGLVEIGPYKFANWYFTQYGSTEGVVDIVKALQRSNDTFFYRVGEMVGEKVLAETASKLGMGKKLGIDLPGEEEGLLPTPDWKEEKIGQIWYPGDTLHFAIGQGFLLTTPLQILAQTSYVASDGHLFVPHLVTKITDSSSYLVKKFEPNLLGNNQFSQGDINLIKKGLSLVPKMGGTAWPFFNFTIDTAGKTGTAEYGDPKGKTHAWYTSYAPESDPQIALTVLIEAGGEGSNIAAPISKQIYTWYFNQDKKNIISLDKEVLATDSARKFGE